MIPFPNSESADAVDSIDDLSNDQLEALSKESILCLSDADRRTIAAYYLLRNVVLSSKDPKQRSVEWIANRVGLEDPRQLRRWREDEDSWSSRTEAALRRLYIGDLRMKSEDERVKVLQKMVDDDKTPGNVRLSAVKELNRMLGSGNAANKGAAGKQKADLGEAQERRAQLRVKMEKLIASVEAGAPDASRRLSEPTPVEPGGSRLSEEPTSDPS
ncbi:MAG: hypothetical protein OXM01_07295 [Gemmatimonadota bacterium]|nr:hypothetical protein [Gemmatimonadota bacterium]